MSQDLIFKGLNQEQKKAVEVLSGPLLILAGAGSGKTKVLTHRIAYLMTQGVKGEKILAVTFTNKAAAEMKSRLEKLSLALGISGRLPLLGTFHSICVRILREDIENLKSDLTRNFVIFDSDDSERILKLCLEDLRLDDKEFKIRALRGAISGLKNQLISPDFLEGKLEQNRFSRAVELLYPLYQKKLTQHNALDFDDLLQKTVELLERNPEILEKYQRRWDHLLVDEYQDTNFAQYRLVRLLVEKHQNLCVVGDDHQSIYRFRGADYRNILEFERDFPKAQIIKLEQNYRSTRTILEHANRLIGHNKTGRKKTLWTENELGDAVKVQEVWDEKEEGDFVAQIIKSLHTQEEYGCVAVLYRTNAQSRSLEEALLRKSIPYQIIGGVRFFDRKEIKDIVAYLRLIYNPRDDLALLRIINVPTRSLGNQTLETLKKYSEEYRLSLYQLLEDIEEIPEFSGAKKEALKSFYKLIESLRSLAQTQNITQLLQSVINQTNYLKFLDDGSSEGESRQQNVRELLSVATRYENEAESLPAFLEAVALLSDADQKENLGNAVTLMTIHASKGLEFPTIFLPGWEEGLFPGGGSNFDEADLEEERRLGYVALTRAEKKCFITYTRQRLLFGKTEYRSPSRFLEELSGENTEKSGYKAQKAEPLERRKGPNFDHPLLTSFPKTKNEAIFGRAENKSAYAIGDRILHDDLGEGTIIQIRGDTLSVAFSGKGIKPILIQSSPIRKLESI